MELRGGGRANKPQRGLFSRHYSRKQKRINRFRMKNKNIEESIRSLQQEGLRFSVDTLAEKLKISKKTIYMKAPDTVTKYLGFTLLPHSGVSLLFTGISATTLYGIDPSLATIVQGTIVAAAIINEIIAVIIAKFAFAWAGEIEK